MKKKLPLISAYEARDILRERKGKISSTFVDHWGNLQVFFVSKIDGRLYRTSLNAVWQKVFENERLFAVKK